MGLISHTKSAIIYITAFLLYIENIIDNKIIKSTNYKKREDFEVIAKELGI